MNMFPCYDINLSDKYFSSLSEGDLAHSGLKVGKRDGREENESAPGGWMNMYHCRLCLNLVLFWKMSLHDIVWTVQEISDSQRVEL